MHEHLTVFIVDDDDAVAASLEVALMSIGLTVSRHSSGQEFLDAFDGQPGCLLVDVRMPLLSGFELQERLVEGGIDLPVIMMTGNADAITKNKAMQNGAIGLLQKPFPFSQLRECVELALQKAAQG